jgi:hypothetical protein
MCVGRSLSGCSDVVSEGDQFQDVVDVFHRLLDEADDDDLRPTLKNLLDQSLW